MTAAERGTATFLFTDIERSTRTAEALGDERYAEVQDEHRRLLREAFAAHGGREVGTEGDGFFVVFGTPSAAVAAAVDGQVALERHAWPDGVDVRVRIGIHTGEALVRDGDYVGHDIHKAKRVEDAGHGGQILLSQTTAELVRASSGDVRLRDLGLHRLKDLSEPERLFQVCAPGLRSDFPPPRSLEAFRTNLPVARSTLVGRTREIAAVREALATKRLVTLTGVGGCGKTRLALHVGAEEVESFEQGTYFVDLATVTDGSQVAHAVIDALSLGQAPGDGGALDVLLLEHLATRSCLLILDNCEHLLDDAADLADSILSRCPKVKILATSREALEVEGEQTWRVPSLSLDMAGDDPLTSDATALFVERARSVDPGFEAGDEDARAIAEICVRLDGIPLAIEFAAARVTHLSPREIATRLDDRFRLLTGGRRRVQRQQTLQAALDWSYDLLDASERTVLQRLAVFVGSCDLDGAEAVCAGEEVPPAAVIDVLGSLVAKSLVMTEHPDGQTRYRLLETVRLYAEDKLHAAGGADDARTAHRDHYHAFLTRRPEELWALDVSAVPILQLELGNLRAALEWSRGRGDHILVGQILERIGGFLLNSGSLEETDRWAAIALERSDDLPKSVRVACMAFQAYVAMFRYDGSAIAVAEAAVAEADGEPSVALVVSMMVMALTTAVAARATGSAELAADARSWLDRVFELDQTDPPSDLLSHALTYRSMTELVLGGYEAAAVAAEDAIELVHRGALSLGGDPSAIIQRNNLIAAARLALDDVDGAVQAAERAFEVLLTKRSVYGDALLGDVCATAAALAASGDVERAKRVARRTLRSAKRGGVSMRMNGVLVLCACVAFHAGEVELGSRLLSAGRQVGASFGTIPFSTPESFTLYELYQPRFRDALGPARAREQRTLGAAMTIDEALAEAEAFVGSDELAVDLA